MAKIAKARRAAYVSGSRSSSSVSPVGVSQRAIGSSANSASTGRSVFCRVSTSTSVATLDERSSITSATTGRSDQATAWRRSSSSTSTSSPSSCTAGRGACNSSTSFVGKARSCRRCLRRKRSIFFVAQGCPYPNCPSLISNPFPRGRARMTTAFPGRPLPKLKPLSEFAWRLLYLRAFAQFGARAPSGMRGEPQLHWGSKMVALLVLLVILLVLGGLGFAVHVLWYVLIAAIILWVLGFFLGGVDTGTRRRGWYRW